MTVPRLAGIHHVKIPVTDLVRSAAWYQRVLGFRVAMRFPDQNGVVQGVVGEIDGLGPAVLALRQNPEVAAAISGFDPVTFAVATQADMEAWAEHLDGLDITHSPVFEASDGWMMVFTDPDGIELQLYSWALHGVDHSMLAGYGSRAEESQ
ncbi:MAG: VOC family protein [Nakamurella sp.]